MKLFKVSGYLALFFGTLAVLLTLQMFTSEQPQFLILALPAAILGYVFSILYIFLKTRNEIKTGIINQGFVGMLLSSVPVVIILYFILTSNRN